MTESKRDGTTGQTQAVGAARIMLAVVFSTCRTWVLGAARVMELARVVRTMVFSARRMLALLIAALFALVPGIFTPAHAASDNANSAVDIVAEIQNDGSAIITDTRTFEATTGTEYYLSWGNLGDSQVTNTNVVLDGQQLTNVGEWDVDRSLEEKAGQFGMRTEDDQIELAFGFGIYAEHTAVMTYQITNFVKNLDDGAQAVYWQFIPQNTTDIEQLRVALTNAEGFTFDQENSRIWAFGFEGDSAIEGSEMTMTSSEPLGADDYAVMLAVWPQAPFQASSELTETTETLTDRAMEGTDFEGGAPTWLKRILGVAGAVVTCLIGGGGLFALATGIFKRRHSAEVSDPTRPHRFKPTVGGDFYWRDAPYSGLPTEVCSMVGTVVPGTVDAMILTWLLDGHVRVIQTTKGVLLKQEVTALEFDVENAPKKRPPIENDLWQICVEAAGDDHVLVPDEFTKWAKGHQKRLRKWVKRAKKQSEEMMIKRGLIKQGSKRFLGQSIKTLNSTDAGQELVNRCEGFKNFVKDFSLLAERESVNVQVWDSYMIWAAMLGVADEARKQFAKLYPDYELESTVIPAVTVTHLIGSSANTSMSTAAAGGGGSSFSSGGGGAFGGGGGGGVR